MFGVGEAKNLLCNVLKKHDNDLLECLQANMYQHGAELITAASLWSGKLGAVNVKIVLEHRAKNRSLKDIFLLAVVDDRHRH